jgi:uncharacterized protein involved in exopolysaccharide biosynthesis
MEDDRDEINLLDYLDVLKKRGRMILIMVSVSVVLAAVISLLLPKKYSAHAVIIPVSESRGGTDRMSAIAMQLGVPTSSSTDAAEIVSLLNSNILMEKVIRRYNLLPVLLGDKLGGKSENEKIWHGIRFLKKDVLRVNNKKTEGVIEIYSEFADPQTSSDILKYILTELTDYMSSEAKRVAETNRKYLESLIDRNSDPMIRQRIYSLIAKQIETSMLAEVTENFAFKIVDPPMVPDRHVKPRIILNIVLAFFVSLFTGIILVFFLEHIENARKARQV